MVTRGLSARPLLDLAAPVGDPHGVLVAAVGGADLVLDDRLLAGRLGRAERLRHAGEDLVEDAVDAAVLLLDGADQLLVRPLLDGVLQRREVRGVDLAHAARPPCSAAVTRPRRPCPRSLRDRTRRPQPGRRIHPGGRSWSAARARSRHGTPCAPGPGWSCTRRSPPATRPAWTPRSWRPWPRRPGGCAAPASRSPPATAPTPPTGGPPTTGVRPGPPPACSTSTSTGASTRSRSAGCAAASGTWSGTRAASSAAGWSSPGPSCTCTRDRWSGPPAMPPRRWRRPAPTATTTWPRSRCSSRGGPWSPPAVSRRAWPCWTRP